MLTTKNFFPLADHSRTRGHSFKIIKVRSRLEIRRNFFSKRVVNEWTELPQYVVDAESVKLLGKYIVVGYF